MDRTFALLERFHDLAPRTRVVLAGRRWLVPPPPGAAAGLLLDPRPYLRVVRVGGFGRQEADAYLDLRDPEHTLSPPLRTALLARSTGGDGEANPFDLACYCAWALAEPGLDPTALRSDGDPYVEQRIIARLPAGPVRECLPVAVELGRFDRGMIEPELRRRAVDVEAAFSGLVSQEWVSAVTFEPDGRAGVIEVDQNLRPRLQAVLAAQAARFPLDRARLGGDLAAHLQERPLDEPAVATVEAALRLLPAPEAGLLWDELERRIATTPEGWAWAGPATARAAAVEVARSDGDGPTILAAIHATQAAVLLRHRGESATELWREVARLADRHPDSTVGARLAFRALCALVDADDIAAAQRLSRAWPHRPAQVDDALAAALDRMSAAPALPPALAPAVDEVCDSGDAAIAVAALLARAAWCQTIDRLDGAVSDVETALRRADAVAAPDDRIHWLPGRLRDRARLARVVLAAARSEPPDQFPLERWRTEALDHLDDIDAERLTAATVLLEHCWRPVDRTTGAHLADADCYRPQRQPTHTWHHALPSLCETAATVLADAGDMTRAADFLLRRREEAVAFGHDPATIGICDRLLVAFSRAFRTTALSTSVHRIAHEGSGTERFDAWATLALVRGESPTSPDEAGGWSTWLRTQIVRPGDPPLVLTGVDPAQEDVDLLELAALTGTHRPDGDLVVVARDRLAGAVTLRNGACPELGALLRTEALCDWPSGWWQLLRRLPPRLVAQAALSEAELLALRLPTTALRLLGLAGERAAAAGDGILGGRAATLLVLTLARAASNPRIVADVQHAAVRTLADDAGDESGWPVRRELALDLIAGVLSRHQTSPTDGSPELDPRPLTGASGEEPPAVTAPAASGPPTRPAAITSADEPHPPTPSRRPRWPRNLALTAIGLVLAGLLATTVLGATGDPVPAPATVTPTPAIPATRTAAPTGTVATTAADPRLAGSGRPSFTPDPPTSRFTPDPPTSLEAPTEPVQAADDTSAAWLGLAVFTVAVVGLLLLARFLLHRARFHLGSPHLRENVSAYPSGARSSAPLSCRLTTTPSEIVVKPGTTWQLLRGRCRWNRPVALLLGQRQGNVTSQQDLARHIPAPRGREPLVVRFRQTRLPLVWQLWGDPPARGVAIGAGYRGPAHLAPQTTSWSPNMTGRRVVLHLVGTPVSTAAGWRLRIPAAASSTVGYRKQSRSLHVGEELVGSDDLAVGSTALVVLQSEPVDGPPQPLGEQYQGVCALAADIRDAGAGAVLVVPPLPDVLAQRVATRVRTEMTQRRHRTHPVHVLDLAQEIKDDIAVAEQPTGGSSRASGDVLLFA